VTSHAAVVELTTSPTGPAKMLISGGIGTGKTSLLGEMRAALRAAGVAVIARAPRDGDPAGAAVVVDDAHLLGGDELEQLVQLVGDPAATLVVAAEPLVHHRELAALTSALARSAPAVSLTPMTPAELTRAAVDILGSAPPAELIRAVATTTAGLPFLAYPALAAIGSLGDDAGDLMVSTVSGATRVALIERLRRVDEAVLDTLLVSSLSPELGPDDIAAALGMGTEAAQASVDRARASGLIAPSHSEAFLRSLHQCLAEIIGTARHRDVELALLRSQIEKSTLSMDLALRMADHGLRDTQLADTLIEFAHRSQAHPDRAARLYRAATEVGASVVSARLAEALALTGDCGTAGRLADELLTSPDPAERAAAVRIAASVAMHDGAAMQAAELFRWLGTYPNAAIGVAGAIVSAGVGDVEATRAAASTETAGPPTSSARAARSLAEGLVKTLDSPYETAISLLVQAITPDATPLAVSPDTAAALVTLTALHAGDAVRARSVIGRAVGGAAVGGTNDGFFGHRHRLLLGWVHMQDGQLSVASAQATAVTDSAADSASPAHLHRRDALWAAALQTGIARRSGDSGAMQKHWYAAMEVLTEYSMDLYSLLPLGELWIVAARTHQLDRIDHSVAEAFKLLDRLGNPVLWSLPLHWAGVHAGILANSPAAVAPHGQALSAAAGNSPLARALATAGRAWLRVLANQVDADEVTAAARALAQFGLAWDATRLASQAALQTPDARVSGAMLQLARDLKVSIVDQNPTADAAGMAATSVAPQRVSPIPASSRLSEREREVAALLLQGMPYRDIGSQLFISAKTVEHHVARIRRRLGAESRSELLSMLRATMGSPT
jgi:DNA-binding CsgD family transcriptional regulator